MKELENIKPEENPPRKHFKPIFGIPPLFYVNFLWLLGVGLILFWVLSLSLKPQSTLIVESNPSGAVVFWNDKIIGNTPLKIKIKDSLKGEGVLSLERKGFKESREELNLTSWPFPFSFLGDRKIIISLDPSLSQQEIINLEIKDLDYWLSLGEPTYRFPSPPLFSQWKSNFKEQEDILIELFKEGFPLINSSFYWNDFKEAYLSFFSLEPASSWELWNNLQENLNLPPEALGFYYSLLSEENQEKLNSDKNFIEEIKNLSFFSNSTSENISPLPLSLLQILHFRTIPSSYLEESISLNPSLSFNREVKIAPFYITKAPISKGQVELFLSSYAKWRPEYREGLMKEELSDESYLKPFLWEDIKKTDPAVFIPYYFAKDFAQWLNNTYLKGTTLKASLPSTLQWQVAMKNIKETNSSYEHINHWFWMRESYSPSRQWIRTKDNLLGVNSDLPLFQAEIRTLNNPSSNTTPETEAYLPKSWTGPNLSFYIVIQEEQDL